MPLEITMLIQINCTANLGDFSNALPVISGLSLYDKRPVDLIIRGEIKNYKLKWKLMIDSVSGDDDIMQLTKKSNKSFFFINYYLF